MDTITLLQAQANSAPPMGGVDPTIAMLQAQANSTPAIQNGVPSQQSESQFWHNMGTPDSGYIRPDYWPLKKDTSTGEISPAIPGTIYSMARGIGDLYQNAETQSTDATPDSINAMMGLATVPGLAESAAAKIGASLADKTPRVGFLDSNSSDPMLAPKPPTPTSAEVRALSSKTFAAADAAGGSLKPNVTNGWIDTSQQLLPQTPAAQIIFGSQTPAEQLISRLQGMRDRPMSLAETQELDSRLGDLAHDNLDPNTGKPTAEGYKYQQVQQNLRDAWGNATEADTIGGKEGFDLAKDARGLWATSAKMNDIERIIARANLMPNPSTSAMTGFRNLSLNPSRMAAYYPHEIGAINDAATVGTGTKMVRAAGNHIVAPMVGAGIGGMLGGEAGAMVGTGVGASVAEAAKALAGKMQLAKGKNVLDMLANRPVVQNAMNPAPPIAAPPAAPMLALPAPETVMSASAAGNQTIPITPATRDILGQSPSTLAEQQQGKAIEMGNILSQARRQNMESTFVQSDAAQEAAKQAQMQQMFPQMGQSAQQLIADAMMKSKDAGLPVGEVGKALARALRGKK